MSVLRKLAGQTAIYGLSSIVARFLNFLLSPFHASASPCIPKQRSDRLVVLFLAGMILFPSCKHTGRAPVLIATRIIDEGNGMTLVLNKDSTFVLKKNTSECGLIGVYTGHWRLTEDVLSLTYYDLVPEGPTKAWVGKEALYFDGCLGKMDIDKESDNRPSNNR
jgi:hypothetical protein